MTRLAPWWIAGIFLVLLACSAWAQEEVTINRVPEERLALHTIDVTVDEAGSASVREQYFFSFFAGEDDQFIIDYQENTPSLSAWRNDYPFIHPYIGIESNTENIEFLLNETANGQPILTLSYKIPAGVVQQIQSDTQGRSTVWRLSDTALLSFISGGRIDVNPKTLIKIAFPRDSVVDSKNFPAGVTVSGNVVSITNIQSNSFNLQYTLLTPIASPVDASQLVIGLVNSPFFSALLVLLLFVSAYVALNRDMIAGQIENYVVEHTEFKGARSDADFETEDNPE